ncbi:MAG: sigma-70 family RNA polymerase sigma factor [Treponema sp.]|nr:sigma-70 family RNA polymerase sigma factor [Treponema sp.]
MKDLNVFGMYLNSMKDVVYLSAEEEALLVKKGKMGDKNARDKVIKSALHYVISVCKTFKHGKSFSMEDLIGYGNIGLVKAFDAYKPEKGTRFITCAAFWIRKEIMDAMGKNSRFIRLPQNCEEELNRIISVMESLPENLCENDKITETCRRLGLKERHVNDLLLASSFVKSLDEPCDADSDSFVLADKICDENSIDPSCEAEIKELCDFVSGAVDNLSNDEAYVLTRRYGLDRKGCRSLSQIGKELGVSKETVRTLERRALAHCRVYENMAEFQDYLAA